jgi:two-component system, LytTR family, response regulator
MKPTCFIIDDEPIAAQGLAEDLHALDLFTVEGIAGDAPTAIECWQRRPVDLLFLDIEMPGSSGLQLLRHFPGKPMVVLVTAYQQYALDGYDYGVVDYLLKPVSPDRLKTACKKALEWYALRHPAGHLFIKCNGRYERIEHSQIQWLEAANNYVWIHTDQKKYLVYQSLKALEDQLPRELFAQTHKSFIVGKQHIRQVHANTVRLPGTEVPLSRRYRAGFLHQLSLTRNFPPVG